MNVKGIRDTAGRIAAGSSAALMFTFVAYRLHFNLSSATSVHLFLVAAIALRWGFLEAGIVSLLSVACLDYFFTAPLFRFYMTDAHDWVALGTFEAAALLVSSLSNRANVHARVAELHQHQLQKLYDLSQNILLLDRQEAVEQPLVDLLRSTLGVKGVALWNVYKQRVSRSGECEMTDEEVCSTYFTETNSDDLLRGVSCRVLRLGTRPTGALVLSSHSLDVASINAAASLVAVALEREHSFSSEMSAEAARQSEQLRSAILDGLAHAFKSPLTTIRTASSGLLAIDTLSGTEKKLVTLIDQHAAHLGDLTNHLLVTAKLDSSDLKIRREEIDLVSLIRSSVEASSQDLGGHSFDIQINSRQSIVRADRKLLPMALLQLLDNAMKYGQPGSTIVVELREEAGELLLGVGNKGSFIPPDEREKVFHRFYRSPGSDHRASGTGVGLSVVRRITEAHKGRAWVVSDQLAGTTFYLALPGLQKAR
jgi:two-component system, OmpR family, sensor histidine kinase KdpD